MKNDKQFDGPAECEGCEEEGCQDCCEHDYDPDEGMMCLNCGAEYPW